MAPPFAQGETLTLTPIRIGKRGEAEAEHEGWRVRVPGGLPGEAARVRITHISKGGPMAVGSFLGPAAEPHPERREAPCPIHETCGGCGLQHVGEDAALRAKLADARRLLGSDGWLEPVTAPRPFHYRAKTFLIPQRRGSRLVLGARPPRGARIVDTSGCNVLRPELEALATRARATLSRRADEEGHLRTVLLRCNRQGRTQLTLVHRGEPEWLEEAAVAIGADAAFLQRHDEPGNRTHGDLEEVQVFGDGPIVERFCDEVDACIPPTAFVQGNPDVAERLYAEAERALEGSRVAELYCGAGVAGLLALVRDETARFQGVDRSPRAIAAARANAERNGLSGRCRFEVAAAEEVSPDWDSVLVNPPRSGCHESVLRAVARSSVGKLAYLSCNPATLARDIARLGWRVDSLLPADMLPQTPHLEVLAVLTRG